MHYVAILSHHFFLKSILKCQHTVTNHLLKANFHQHLFQALPASTHSLVLKPTYHVKFLLRQHDTHNPKTCLTWLLLCKNIIPKFNSLGNKYWFLPVPVGQKSMSGLARWFWLRISWICNQDVSQGCRYLQTWLQLKKLLPQLFTQMTIAGCHSSLLAVCRRPQILTSQASPCSCSSVLIIWQLPFPRESYLKRERGRAKARVRANIQFMTWP